MEGLETTSICGVHPSANEMKKEEMTVAVRTAVPADVEEILDLMNGHRDPRLVRKLKGYVRKPDRDLILAVKDDKILGFICMLEKDENLGDLPGEMPDIVKEYAAITQLWVVPEFRNRGIGRLLVRSGEQWARARSIAGFWLVTHRMAAWYRKHLGYRELGRVNARGVVKTVMVKSREQDV
jgi:ribosomal protein S18 acetylase RimI-like enzyme